MIRSAIHKLLGGGCESHEAELAILRQEVRALRSRIAELEGAGVTTAPEVQASSFAQAARILAQGQPVRLVQGGASTDPAQERPSSDAEPAGEAAVPTTEAGSPQRRLVVELEDCIACGTCVEYCADAFELGTDGRARVVSTDVPPHDLQDAMDACPTQCILWQD